jgi:hypothetical protein
MPKFFAIASVLIAASAVAGCISYSSTTTRPAPPPERTVVTPAPAPGTAVVTTVR